MQQPAWERNILGLWKAAMAGGAGWCWSRPGLTQIFPLLVETELRRGGNIARLDWSSESGEWRVGPGQGCLLSRCRGSLQHCTIELQMKVREDLTILVESCWTANRGWNVPQSFVGKKLEIATTGQVLNVLDLWEQNRQCSDSRVLCVITILTGYMSSHVQLSSVLTAHSVIW